MSSLSLSLSFSRPSCFEARTSEIKHLRSRLALEQILYFSSVKRIFEEIALFYFHVLLRKKLFRCAAGISLYPAIELNLHRHFPFLLF